MSYISSWEERLKGLLYMQFADKATINAIIERVLAPQFQALEDEMARLFLLYSLDSSALGYQYATTPWEDASATDGKTVAIYDFNEAVTGTADGRLGSEPQLDTVALYLGEVGPVYAPIVTPVQFGNGRQCDTVDDAGLSVADTGNVFRFLGSMSLEALIDTTELDQDGTDVVICARGLDTGTNAEWRLFNWWLRCFGNGTYQAHLAWTDSTGFGKTTQSSVFRLPVGECYLAVTRHDTTGAGTEMVVRFYAQGAQVGEDSVSQVGMDYGSQGTFTALCLGNGMGHYSYGFTGVLDALRLCDEVLPPDEIAAESRRMLGTPAPHLLQVLGRIVGETYAGQSTDAFTALIRARIQANRSTGTDASLRRIIEALLNSVGAPMRLSVPSVNRSGIRDFEMTIEDIIVEPERDAAVKLIGVGKEASTRAIVRYQLQDSGATFSFENGPGLGFGAGQFAGAKEP